jgi:hypothetical protein
MHKAHYIPEIDKIPKRRAEAKKVRPAEGLCLYTLQRGKVTIQSMQIQKGIL